jgi:hypothetical protein
MLHVVLAFCDSHYWLSQYPNYSLLTLLFIVNYTLQLYIVAREVRKCQRRHLASTIYWIIIFITELIEIVVVEVRNSIDRKCYQLLVRPRSSNCLSVSSTLDLL